MGHQGICWKPPQKKYTMAVPPRPLDHMMMMMMNELHFLTFGHTRGLISRLSSAEDQPVRHVAPFPPPFRLYSLYINSRVPSLFWLSPDF